jgi:hypothetical protein
MKKQIFTIILFTIVSLNVLGQFRLDGGTNSVRLQTGGVDRMYVHPTNGNIGVGTVSPSAQLDVNGDVHISGDLRVSANIEALNTATHDPFLRDGRSYILMYNNTGATVTTIKGFDAPTYGDKNGTILYLTNDYNGSIILKHNVSAIAANGIETNTGSDVTITSNGGAIFLYSNLKWRLIAYAQ